MTPGDLARRIPWWLWVAVAVALAGALAWRSVTHLQALTRTKIAEAKAWDIQGPPCPRLDKAAFLKGRKRGPRGFVYEDVGFYRRSGYADCAAIYYDGGRSDRFYPVCQFTSPGQLMVRTRKGEAYFEPGPGQAATVSTANGEARCVMASHVTMKTVRERGVPK